MENLGEVMEKVMESHGISKAQKRVRTLFTPHCLDVNCGYYSGDESWQTEFIDKINLQSRKWKWL